MKNKNIVDSFNNSINGIMHTLKAERNMKIHILAAMSVLIFSFFFDLTSTEFLVLCITVGGVIICELFNTAIETVVDIIVDGYHPKAKIAKDVAAGAVLVSSGVAVMVGYIIFFNRVATGLEVGIQRIRNTPMHITLIAIIIIFISVLSLKAFFKRGTPLHGGMPSGHAALSAGITTAVAFWTGSIRITILCAILGILMIQSRLEAKVHSAVEIVAGVLLGSLITLLLFEMFYI